ncbi:toxin-activating lysine-acyltransferase [Psychromarinibacter halotolerans]|uniref:RTX toxin-activating lysine-acyltransferase n=1 Tax=Psychromarinibacter halotolerans TaxID=1775175 RepID=A0ABV7GM42_9RHOB|nr:toxin-activating lysine-acyltransferase [Psychromarinibacter halotolerans]MDF0597090.1 toxin-activating lysine-acyltransferase [Psychromarinibacter halotolerans]
MSSKTIQPDHPDAITLSALGEIAFLAGRSPVHSRAPTDTLRHWWETPIALNQYWCFRADGVPRLALSWASLSPEAERRYVVDRKPLRIQDWWSGPQKWVIDWIAPFAIPRLNMEVRRWLVTTGFRDSGSVRFLRVGQGRSIRSITELNRAENGTVHRDFLDITAFQTGGVATSRTGDTGEDHRWEFG